MNSYLDNSGKYIPILFFLWLLGGCQSDEKKSLTIRLQLAVNGKAFTCNDSFLHEKHAWRLTQFQMYFHQFEVKNLQNEWQDAQPKVADDLSSQVILLGGVCDGSENWSFDLQTNFTRKEVSGIRFHVGVPWELNHLNPMTQPTPLNQSDMFWTWQMGYKFARIELANEENEWIFHLGSTGCSSTSPVRAPETACKNPNMSSVSLENFSAGSTIIFDIGTLVTDIDLIKYPNCQSTPDTPSCDPLMEKMGIGTSQKVFSIEL